jgi:hypothetical protein
MSIVAIDFPFCWFYSKIVNDLIFDFPNLSFYFAKSITKQRKITDFVILPKNARFGYKKRPQRGLFTIFFCG